MGCTKNCNACRYWSTEGAQFFSRIMTECTSHIQFFKSWMNWSQFYVICDIQPDLLPTDCHFLKHSPSTTFAGKTLLQPVGGRKCFPRVCEIPKPGFLHTGINKCISHWQKCVDCNDPILSNKDVWAYLLICWFNSHSLKPQSRLHESVLLWLITISI